MSKTVTELKAELDAVNAEWDASHTAIQGLRGLDKEVNEGGEGFSSYEHAAERLAAEYLPRVTALGGAIFAAEWTAEVTAERRAAWNAEIGKMGAKIQPEALKALVARLGYSHKDIARAKALHGIK